MARLERRQGLTRTATWLDLWDLGVDVSFTTNAESPPLESTLAHKCDVLCQTRWYSMPFKASITVLDHASPALLLQLNW
jgi:hypothetical protein